MAESSLGWSCLLPLQVATIKDEREHINKLLEAITPGVATYVRLHPASDLGSFEISQRRKLTVSGSTANKKASIEVNKVFGPRTSQEDVANPPFEIKTSTTTAGFDLKRGVSHIFLGCPRAKHLVNLNGGFLVGAAAGDGELPPLRNLKAPQVGRRV